MSDAVAVAAGGARRSPWPLAAALLALAAIGVAAAAAGVDAQRVWVLLVLAPLLEEAVFRAGLQDLLLRRALPAWQANLLTALAFGLAHAALRGDAWALAVAVPALLVGCVYERTRRLRWCVALHALMNALWLAGQLAGALPGPGR